METEKRHLIRFLILTFVISFAFEAYIVSLGGIKAWPQSTLILMWIPGLTCIAYRLFARIGFKDLGLTPGKPKYWFFAFAVPFAVALISNVICWAAGINEFVPYPEAAMKKAGLESVPMLILLKYPWWLFWACVSALGEEIGWRGFLIPKLTYLNVRNPLTISALIWGVWHIPLILWGGYATSEYPVVSVLLFMVLIVMAGVFVGWLRMESGSVWVAMFYHACHNLFLQLAFAVFSKSGPLDPLLGGESGVIPCIIYGIVLFLGYRFLRSPNRGQPADAIAPVLK